MPILLEVLCVALLAVAVARLAPEPWRGRILNVLKGWVTLRIFWVLLQHEVRLDPAQIEALHLGDEVPAGATHVEAWRLIRAQLGFIDLRTFVVFCLAAAGIKFVGILSSMFRWLVLLRGQGIELPFRHVFGSFLIGRFIGTFLPSTAGLDGYLLYDAARFSGRTVEVTAAKALEKVIGVTGILLSFLVALPAGMGMFYSIFDSRGTREPRGRPRRSPFSAGVIGALLAVLFFPGLVQWGIEHLPLPGKARLEGVVLRISRSAAAYRDKKPLVALVLFLSFLVHFTTAVMYYFTALAISAPGVEFWPVVLGSSIQILATVLSPFTIAGEGIRELAQLLLLKNMIGPAGAIVSAALGFWAAEALTLAGGFFWWLRPADYRPAWCRVDGVQVDYEEAARAALTLETEDDAPAPRGARRRARGARRCARAHGAGLGLGAGILAGLLIALPEAAVIAAGGLGSDAQVAWYGPLAYGPPARRARPRGRRRARAAADGRRGPARLDAGAGAPRDARSVRPRDRALPRAARRVPRADAARPGAARDRSAASRSWRSRCSSSGRASSARAPGALTRPLPALALLAAVTAAGAGAAQLFGRSRSAGAGARGAGGARGEPERDPRHGRHAARRPPLLLRRRAADPEPLPHRRATARLTRPSPTRRGRSRRRPRCSPRLVPDDPRRDVEDGVALAGRDDARGGDRRRAATRRAASRRTSTSPRASASPRASTTTHYLAPDYLFGARESSSKLILYQIASALGVLRLDKRLYFGDFYQDSEVVNGVAFDWLERHRGSRFFLFLHYMDPHDPYFEHPYNGVGIARAANQLPEPALAGEMRRLYRARSHTSTGTSGSSSRSSRSSALYDDTLIALVCRPRRGVLRARRLLARAHALRRPDPRAAPRQVAEGPTAAPPGTPEGIARLIDVAPTLLGAGRRARSPRRCRASTSPCRTPSAPRRTACTSRRRITRGTCCGRSAPRAGS